MLGLMQDRPLLISSLLDYAAEYHGEGEIVSRTVEGPIHRYTYTDALKRSKQLAKALQRLDVKLGDRVATLAWNGYRHFELYYGVSGLGAVLHTINPRLFAEQIIYIVNHAEDDYIFTELTFVPLLEQLQDQFEGVKGFVVMTDEDHMPETSLENVLCYETLLAAEDDDFEWPTFDENTASSLCYTSGTTGNPKGVLYSHRSTVLHSFIVCMKDTLGLSSMETVLPVVPMFHANSWGIAYAAPMCGAKLVFPGAGMDGASVYEMLDTEKVTTTAGVPTVWLMLLNHMRENNLTLENLKSVICGGSAAPRAMIEEFEEAHGARMIHAWGMTEMSPIGTCGTLKTGMDELSSKERYDIQEKQGRGIYGVEMKIIDDDGNEQPRDGEAFGNLLVRGPAICSGYFKGDGGQVLDDDGWFDTGDVANIDDLGYMQIVDRSKDVIKSGGEWISSIDLENTAVGHPEVVEACVIGVYHPKWDERPLLLLIKTEGSSLDRESMLSWLEGKIVKWWTPDDVVFVDELPHTATGKLLKSKLRDEYQDYKLPTA
jgi:acyl-CoA synthetase (AMP-forming)/AMP-acid ligase II